jgi:hypothetical protein
MLQEKNIPIPDHHLNLITTCAALISTIRAEAGERLETFTEDFGPVATSRKFKINRRTVPGWIDHPERIPIEKAVKIVKGVPHAVG